MTVICEWEIITTFCRLVENDKIKLDAIPLKYREMVAEKLKEKSNDNY